jgi:Flp pilus assembly pilin Flp
MIIQTKKYNLLAIEIAVPCALVALALIIGIYFLCMKMKAAKLNKV